eukprot:3892382-Rhodomonas_salina.1
MDCPMTVSWNAGYGEDPVQRFPRLVGQHEGAHLHVRFVQLSFRLILAQFLLNLAPLELVSDKMGLRQQVSAASFLRTFLRTFRRAFLRIA